MSQSSSVSASSNPIGSSKAYHSFLAKNDHSKESLFQALLDLSATTSTDETLFLPSQDESSSVESSTAGEDRTDEATADANESDSKENTDSESTPSTGQPLIAICSACPEDKAAAEPSEGVEEILTPLAVDRGIDSSESDPNARTELITIGVEPATGPSDAIATGEPDANETLPVVAPQTVAEESIPVKSSTDIVSDHRRSKGDRRSSELETDSHREVGQGKENDSANEEQNGSSSPTAIDLRRAGFEETTQETLSTGAEGNGLEQKGRRAERLEENRTRESDSKDQPNRDLATALAETRADQDTARQGNRDSSHSSALQDVMPFEQNVPNVVAATSVAMSVSSPGSTLAVTSLSDSTTTALNANAQGVQSVNGSTGAGTIGQGTSERFSNSSAKQASGSGGSSPLTARQEVRLVQRVMRGFEQLSNGEGQVKLRLHPPQLGSLQMQLRMDGSQMTARLEVENATAKEAIMENLPKLRERLVEQGIQIEKFEVEVTKQESPTNRQSNDSSNFNNSSHQSLDQDGGQAGMRRRSVGAWRSELVGDHRNQDVQVTISPRGHATRKSGLDLTA